MKKTKQTEQAVREQAAKKTSSVYQAKWAEWARQCDWRTPADYPKPGAVSWDRWAWEFLRRNASFVSELNAMNRADKRGEAAQSPRDVAMRAIKKKWKIDMFYLAEWVEGEPDKFDAPVKFKTGMADSIFMTHSIPGNEGDFHIVKQNDNEFLYRVNLNWPIEPQVRAIKRHALINQDSREQGGCLEQIKVKRQHVKKFPFYLRCFDAIEAGEKSKDVADCLAKEYTGGISEKRRRKRL